MPKSATSTENRRVDPRRRPLGNLHVRCLKGTLGLGPNIALAVLDASETGIRLLVEEALNPDQEIEVSVTGPSRGRPCTRRARVVWCVPAVPSGYCVGARFNKRLSYSHLQDICR